MNDRIRREGTQNLVEAALRNGCQLYVQQSVTFIYGDRKGDWVDEQADIAPQPGGILQSAIDMEQIVQAAEREWYLPATILRYGSFYSDDAAHTRMMLALIRQGRLPVIGDGAAYANPIHVDDAALAVVKAIDNPANAVAHIFNVCDDEPVTYRQLVSFVSQALGARQPRHWPISLAKLLLGAHTVGVLRASVRCRNERVKETLGWRPQYPNYRAGYAAVVEEWSHAGGVSGLG
jgi:nucleoside-diphosphate-sugar epimerase